MIICFWEELYRIFVHFKFHSYRIEYRNCVLKDPSHQKEYRPTEEIESAYKCQKSIPSIKSVLYSRIELLPKISKNSSKYRDCYIPCAILCRTSSEIYSSMLFYSIIIIII